MTVPGTDDCADPYARRVQMLVARLTDLALLLPGVADRIVADDISPRELSKLANRLHGIAGHMAVVADHKRKS